MDATIVEVAKTSFGFSVPVSRVIDGSIIPIKNAYTPNICRVDAASM